MNSTVPVSPAGSRWKRYLRWTALAVLLVVAALGVFLLAVGGKEGAVVWYVRHVIRTEAAPTQSVLWQAGPASAPALAAGTAPRAPNIVLIVADDLGYNDITLRGGGIAGNLVPTPNINRIATEGAEFTTGYSGNATCSPSRAALLTGRYPTRVGFEFTSVPVSFSRIVGAYRTPGAPADAIFHEERVADMPPYEEQGLPTSEISLARLLKGGGYHTVHLGKWHLGGEGEYAPEKRGFEWCSTNVGGPNVHFDPVIVRNRKRESRKGYREDLFFEEAMAFMDECKDAPFFCYLATYSPHAPLAAPEEFVAPFRGKVDKEEAAYLGMVANLDYNLGRLMKYLQARKLEDNTILIFMNDNGQTHGLDVFNAGMRGSKCTIWQGGSRAISFWKWAGKWPPHKVQNLTAHLDVLPTLCDLAGATIPPQLSAKLEGFSLRPLLESTQPIEWNEDRLLFHHVGRWPSGMAAAHKHAMASVQTGDLLLVRSRPCDDPACKTYSSQCTTLRFVEAGATAATYTKTGAQFHWGVTPPGRW